MEKIPVQRPNDLLRENYAVFRSALSDKFEGHRVLIQTLDKVWQPNFINSDIDRVIKLYVTVIYH